MCETKREGGSGETHREERETVWEEREGERQRKVRESERDSERKSDSERVKEGES